MEMGFWKKLPRPFVSLAPMEGVTDTVFRRSIAKFGRPDVFYTEFTNVNGICSEGFDKVSVRLKYLQEERPIVAQIWGVDPEIFFAAAHKISELGVDGIDINLGCPVRDVVKIGACSRMIEKEQWQRVKEIIAATREGGKLPVSVKTRIGYKKVVTEDWADFLLDQGLAEITFHLRTAAEQSAVPASWEEMEKIVDIKRRKKTETLICGNGDVKDRQQAKELFLQFQMDGVMIGRGVFENPAAFAAERRILTKTERLMALSDHARLYEAEWQGKKPFGEMKKNIKMYVAGYEGAAAERQTLMGVNSYAELTEKLQNL